MSAFREARFSLRAAARALCLDREKLAMLCDARISGQPIVRCVVVPGRFRRRVYIMASELERVRRVVIPQLRAILEALAKERETSIGRIGGAMTTNPANAAKNL